MKTNYDRSLLLLCPTCASSDFAFEDTEPEELRVYVCNSCGLSASHQAIMESNAERISAAVDELKNDVVADFSKDIRATFKGLKGWTVK